VATLPDVFRSFGVSEPYFVEWRGLQELWGYLRDAPLSLVLLVIWFLFTGVAGTLYGSGIQNGNRSDGSAREILKNAVGMMFCYARHPIACAG
jgi:hypothetical protein